MEDVVDRFLRYTRYDTRSKEDVSDFPSTKGQLTLLSDIAKELNSIGMKDVSIDKFGYVFGTLPANTERSIPAIGFISHVDTSPEMPGNGVNAQLVENYDGGDIVLNRELKIVLSPDEFPELKKYVGKTLITTDGTTLLGADDKSGVAEIVTAMEYLTDHPEIKHGEVKVGFTPDEEVGRGVDFFDTAKFGAKYAYTVDGGGLGGLEYENFNAAAASITVRGKNVHPGSAKGIMKNSMLIAAELMMMLPDDETPSSTDGYQGFYHIIGIRGSVEQTKMKYIIRDFEMDGLNSRKAFIEDAAERLNKKYGEGTVTVELKDQYYNMKEKIKEHMDVVDKAKRAIEEIGLQPVIQPIRGGTDGARLSFIGLPCPNLFTGGHNYHGRYEFIPTFAMEMAVDVILKIIELYTK